MRTLVVYFSRKGYAKRLAEAEAARLGADVLRLETTERTAGYPGFWWCGRFGMHRWGMPLKPYETDISTYDRVLLVSPVWVFGLCAPMRSFVKAEAGRIKQFGVMLVHFSSPMGYGRTLKQLDDTLGVSHAWFDSVQCIWGRMLRRVRVDGQKTQVEA